jgi:hypothetical protein
VSGSKQDFGVAVRTDCRLATADGQHGVILQAYTFLDTKTAQAAFTAVTAGALPVSGLGDQALRSFADLFVLSGLHTLKLTYLEPFNADEQSGSHQAEIGKSITALAQLALQHVSGLPAITVSTTTTTRPHTTTTTKR